MNFGSGREGVVNAPTAGVEAIAPPLTKAAAAATPKRAAIHGIAIPQIAPVDNPLLLFFETGITVLLVDGKLVVMLVVGVSGGGSSILSLSSDSFNSSPSSVFLLINGF
jgi:hypothetical protein